MENTNVFGLVPFAHACKLLGVTDRTGRNWISDPDNDFPRPSIKIGRLPLNG